jgi:L-cystine transport system permease protein
MSQIDYFSFVRVFEYLWKSLAKIHVTFLIASTSLILGLLIAVLLAVFLLFKTPVIYQLIRVYISFMRAIPINIQLFIFFYGLPALLSPFFARFGVNVNRANPIYFVIATYAISSSAFLSIMLSASINGVDVGQHEAALSIGMTKMQMFKRVIAPQAFNIALPDLGNNIVSTIKNTSLAYTVGVLDMVGVTRSIAVRTHHSLEGYVANAVVYFVLCTALERIFGKIEKKNAVFN